MAGPFLRGTWKGAGFSLATAMACTWTGENAGDKRIKKGVNSLEEVFVRAPPATIHANFLCAVHCKKWKKMSDFAHFFGQIQANIVVEQPLCNLEMPS